MRRAGRSKNGKMHEPARRGRAGVRVQIARRPVKKGVADCTKIAAGHPAWRRGIKTGGGLREPMRALARDPLGRHGK